MATTHGPNLDIWIEVPSWPKVGGVNAFDEFDALQLMARGTGPLGAERFITIEVIAGFDPNDIDFTGDTLGPVGGGWGSVTISPVDGDAFGMRLNGTVFSAYWRTGGVWTLMFSGTPSNYIAAYSSAGICGFYGGSQVNPGSGVTSWQLDNFTIAEWSGTPPTFPAARTAGDNFNQPDGTLLTDTPRWAIWYSLSLGSCAPNFALFETQNGRAINTLMVYPCGFDAVKFTNASGGSTPTGPTSGRPIAPWTPCTPETQVNNGGKGKYGCNTGGTDWVSSYTGPYGNVPQHADPVDGETLDGKAAIDIWMEINHQDYPSNDITTYRRGTIALAHVATYEGGVKDDGVESIGDIQHAISNEQGGFEAAAVDIQYADLDRLLRNTLGDQELEGDEMSIRLASPGAAANNIPPRIAMRGVIQQPPRFFEPLRGTLTAVDSLFSDYGPIGQQRTWPPRIPSGAFSTAPPDTLSQDLPWIYGEKSDEGARDPVTNELKSKGLCPLIFAGRQAIGVTPNFQLPVTQSSANMNGGTLGPLGWSYGTFVSDGTTNNTPYQAVARVDGTELTWIGFGRGATPSPDGTVYGLHTVWIDPDTSPADYYICFLVPADYPTWNPFTNPAPDTETRIRYQIVRNPVDPFGDGFWEFGDAFWGSFSDGMQWPLVPGGDEWDVYIVTGHPCFRIISLYGSNLANGNPELEPDRVRIDLDVLGGSEFLAPGFPGWPFPTNYVEYVDDDGTVYWLTVIFAKGPISDDHKNGRVTMAANIIGVEDVGDGTGLPLIDEEDCKQHWVENALIGRWTSGLWADELEFPMWEDGTAKVRSSSFAARKLYQQNSFGGRGLTIGWYVGTAQSISEHVREWNLNESLIGINGHGQVISFGVDEFEDTSGWNRVNQDTDWLSGVTRVSGIGRENVVKGRCDWDPDTDRFRGKEQSLVSESGIAKFKNHQKVGTIIESKILNVEAQLRWVLQNRRRRLDEGMAMQELTGPLGLMDHDVGEGHLLTTREGLGASGFIDRTMLCIRRRLSVTANPPTVSYTLWDVSKIYLTANLPGGQSQLPIVTDTAGNNMLVTDNADLAPAIL